MTRSDLRGSHIEEMVDKGTEKLLQISRLVQKKTGARPDGTCRNLNRACSCCKELGHGANCSTKNPHRYTRCDRCGKISHDTTLAEVSLSRWLKWKSLLAQLALGLLIRGRELTMAVTDRPLKVVAIKKRNAAGKPVPKALYVSISYIDRMLNQSVKK